MLKGRKGSKGDTNIKEWKEKRSKRSKRSTKYPWYPTPPSHTYPTIQSHHKRHHTTPHHRTKRPALYGTVHKANNKVPPRSSYLPTTPGQSKTKCLHRTSLAIGIRYIVETYFWHYCGVTHTICFFSLHQTLSYLYEYTSSTIEDTSLHFLHSSFIVIVIVRSTYLSRSQMVDSQGCSLFSLR